MAGLRPGQVSSRMRPRMRRGRLLRCGRGPQAVHDMPVQLGVGRLVKVESTGELFGVNDVGKLALGKAQHGDRDADRGAAHAERQHLDGDVRKLGGLDELPELGSHRRDAANRPAQRCLVDHGPQARRGWLVKELLAAHPQVDAALDLGVRQVVQAGPDEGVGVVPGLQQARNEVRFVTADEAGGRFKPEVRLEPARDHVAVGVPPPLRIGLPGHGEQCRAFVLVADAIKGQEIGHISRLESGPA